MLTVVGPVAVGASAYAAETRGELRIRERPTSTGDVYIEGAYQYVRVTRTRDGAVVLHDRSATKLASDVKLPPGFYRVSSWTRTCDGTCDDLDAPSNRCHGFFRVRAGRFVTASIRSEVGERCRITNP
jgi:hypothetical protein